jgi:16S rRNA (uracil1498-N3)-methyltransferase
VVLRLIIYGGDKMPRFFADVSDENNIIIGGDDARHIGRSLRMKPGEKLTVCCRGIDYNCVISSITADSVYLELINSERCASEPNIQVTLFQAVPKLDKLEHIIQKTVELGVSRIVPVLSRRCVSRPEEKDFSKKLVRLNKIAEQAAKQSGRGIIPQVTPIISFKNAVEEMKTLDRSIILYEEKGGCSFGAVDFAGVETVGIMIGSEGGFDPEEAELAATAGAYRVWLGKRILRCETAPTTAMSILMFLTGNM